MQLTGYGVCAIVSNWALFFLCGGVGELFDKFGHLRWSFCDMAMCLTAKGWHIYSLNQSWKGSVIAVEFL